MELINAYDNVDLYVSLFDRFTRYAPYTVKLGRYVDDMFKRCKNFTEEEHLIYIGKNENEHGLIHAGTFEQNKGIIYLLFADSNQLAVQLLRHIDKRLISKGCIKIYGYFGHPSPYDYILHGTESYCWAGNYPANNAFVRCSYDLELDIIVMSKKLTGISTSLIGPEFFIPPYLSWWNNFIIL